MSRYKGLVRKLASHSGWLAGMVFWVALVAISFLAPRFLAPTPERNRTLGIILLAEAAMLTAAMFGIALAWKQRRLLVLALIAIACGGVTGYVSYRRYSTPPFVFDRLSVTLSVKDTEGRTGHFVQEEELLVQKDEIGVFVQHDLGAPGEEVKNVRVAYDVGTVVRQQLQERGKGLYDVTTFISPPLKKGARVRRMVDFDITAAPSNMDSHVLLIDLPTKYVEVRLMMPSGRPCKSATSSIKGGPAEGLQPRLLDGGLRLLWSTENPRVGTEYTIVCLH